MQTFLLLMMLVDVGSMENKFVLCRWLTGSSLTQALQGSLELHTLDIQHIDVTAEAVLHLKQKLPLLKSVLHAQQHS